MSYDVSVGKFSANYTSNVWRMNYTSNVWRMFHNHIRHGDKTGVQALDGLAGRAAGVILAHAIEAIHAESCSYESPGLSHYDRPNGWGDATGAVLFLARILGACHRYPRSIVRVSY